MLRPILASLSAAVALLSPAASYNLRVYPQKNEVYRYKMSGSITIASTDAAVNMNVTESVRTSDETGWSLTVAQTDGMVKFEGQENPLPDVSQIIYYNPDGTIKSIKADTEPNQEGLRLMQMSTFFRPNGEVPANLDYSYDFPADQARGIPEARATYRIVGEEIMLNMPVIRIDFRYAETAGDVPARNSGTFWIHKDKGVVVKLVQTWTDAPVTGSGAVGGRFTTELVLPNGGTL